MLIRIVFPILLIKTIISTYNDIDSFENSNDKVVTFLETFNSTEFYNICNEGYYEECYRLSNNYLKSLKPSKSLNNDTSLTEDQVLYNQIISDFYYFVGFVEYYGLIKKKPNLFEGFAKFIISAYLGNSKAYYKLYIILETDIIDLIINQKEYLQIKADNPLLNYISNTNFYENFNNINDHASKSSIAFNFLYISALSKYPPAMNTIAYKYQKGYGVSSSCDIALKYYKATSLENVREITRRKRPNYYEKLNIASFEYVGHKFSNEIMDIDDIIDYFKVEAQNGQITYIQQLGSRYLYGQGIPQDFNQAFHYFKLGSTYNDSSSIYYLGEMYLNGWGVTKDYQEAFRLFSQAMTLNSAKAWNSLGYMYYYGLGVEKNVKRAYDYFKVAFTKGDDADAYYDFATLLAEGNDFIETDFPNAYKYSNFIAAKGHTFGVHFFGMLNEYQLGSVIKTCDITIEFFKQVAQRNLESKRLFDLAIKFYREGYYKVAALIYIELAESGFEYGQVNAGTILKNYDIFISSSFNRFLSYKYFKMAHKERNHYATLNLADFYHYGFGDLPANYTKAREYYRKVAGAGSESSQFYIAHSYFNLGVIHHFGKGVEQNYTKASRYYNLSSNYEPNAFYPSLLMNYYIAYHTTSLWGLIKGVIYSVYAGLTTLGIPLYVTLTVLIGYSIFFLSLYYQKS